jgi:hypothetical protein
MPHRTQVLVHMLRAGTLSAANTSCLAGRSAYSTGRLLRFLYSTPAPGLDITVVEHQTIVTALTAYFFSIRPAPSHGSQGRELAIAKILSPITNRLGVTGILRDPDVLSLLPPGVLPPIVCYQ